MRECSRLFAGMRICPSIRIDAHQRILAHGHPKLSPLSHLELILIILSLFALALLLACPSSLTLPSIVSSFLTLLTSERGIFLTINYMQYFWTGCPFHHHCHDVQSISWDLPSWSFIVVARQLEIFVELCSALQTIPSQGWYRSNKCLNCPF